MKKITIALCITLGTLYPDEWHLTEGFKGSCHIATPKSQKFPLLLLIEEPSERSILSSFNEFKGDALLDGYAIAAFEKNGDPEKSFPLYRDYITQITQSIGDGWNGEIFLLADGDAKLCASKIFEKIPEIRGLVCLSMEMGLTSSKRAHQKLASQPPAINSESAQNGAFSVKIKEKLSDKATLSIEAKGARRRNDSEKTCENGDLKASVEWEFG